MEIIADLHIHTRHTRGASKDMTLDRLEYWARRKGVNLLGTGDFTHPAYFKLLKENLTPAGNGLFFQWDSPGKQKSVFFMLSAEISTVFMQGGKMRKLHSLVYVPSFEAAEKFMGSINRLGGNLNSDGRPMFGFSAYTLLNILKDASPDAVLIPAHIWNPWFSLLGSQSGFDSLEECFGSDAKEIFAVETGLATNPEMNWRISALDSVSLVSNSDAHSPSRLMREATVLNCDMDYSQIFDAIRSRDHRFVKTIETPPQLGNDYLDGHKLCGVRLTPRESKVLEYQCPVCKDEVSRGIMNRIKQLADRQKIDQSASFVPFETLFPLEEALSFGLKKGPLTQTVQKEYHRIIDEVGSEYALLSKMSSEDIRAACGARTARYILQFRDRSFNMEPGYDGQPGVMIFEKPQKTEEPPVQLEELP